MPQGMAPPKRAAGKQSTCVLSFPALYIFLKAVRTRDPADLIPFAQFRFRENPAFRRQLTAADRLLDLLQHSAVHCFFSDWFMNQFIQHDHLQYLIPVLLYLKKKKNARVYEEKFVFFVHRSHIPTINQLETLHCRGASMKIAAPAETFSRQQS